MSDLEEDNGISSNELDSCDEEANISTTNTEENLIPMLVCSTV